jgi:MFS transporter, SP family, sugar:H+ symporter
MIPETKGLSLEQVDLLYRHSTPRQSIAFRNRMMEENMHDEIMEDGTIQVHLDHRLNDGKRGEVVQEEKVSV